MPLRTVSNDELWVMSSPLNTILPRRGGVKPTIELTSVVLPTPLRPKQTENLALLELERQSLQDVGVAVVGVDVLNFQDRHVLSLSPGRFPGPSGCS